MCLTLASESISSSSAYLDVRNDGAAEHCGIVVLDLLHNSCLVDQLVGFMISGCTKFLRMHEALFNWRSLNGCMVTTRRVC